MAAIIRDEFKVKTLDTFISSLATNSMYLGIGRPYFWDTVANTDTTIPVPENTVAGISGDWEDCMALKKLISTDVYHGIYKEVWTPNVKYDTYRHDWNGSGAIAYNGQSIASTLPTSISDVKCFVVTANYGIYCCIKNKTVNGEVQPSLYTPDSGVAVGTNTGVVKTADGYYWKYIAATSPADLIKFSSKYYHPIETIPSAPAPADPYYPQWLSQENSKNFKGGIYVINVTTAGVGYNNSTAGTRPVTNAETDAELAVIGDGTGLQYTVTYGAGGSIVDIEITNPGAGYTFASIKTGATGSGAVFDIVFTPMRGLGVDPVYDTVARYLLINTKLEGAEGLGDFTVSNEYRKIILVYNPTNYGTTTAATAPTLDATITLNVGTGLTSAAYPVDAIVTGATSLAVGRVVDFNTTTGNLRIIRTGSENKGVLGANNSFQVGESLSSVPGIIPGLAWRTIVSITNPEVQINSGSIIYSEYRAPITRSVGQTESLNVIIKF